MAGSDLAAWLTSRGTGYSASQVADAAAVTAVTLCLVRGDFAYPHPDSVLPSGSPVISESTEAIEIVGLSQTPRIDSVGPASKLETLWKDLQDYVNARG